MPFIKAKVSSQISEEQEIELKAGIGKAIELVPGKAKNLCSWSLKTTAVSGFAEEMKNPLAGFPSTWTASAFLIVSIAVPNRSIWHTKPPSLLTRRNRMHSLQNSATLPLLTAFRPRILTKYKKSFGKWESTKQLSNNTIRTEVPKTHW